MNEPTLTRIHLPVKHALKALLYGFVSTQQKRGNTISGTETLLSEMEQVLSSSELFPDKLKKMDTLISSHAGFAPLGEYLFDLLMVNFLAAESQLLSDEYLESPEWAKVEDETIDRGTELLNLLLYINEAVEDDVEVSIDDFLREFLLAEEDGFQDEHRIYEDLITHQEMAGADTGVILDAFKEVDEDSPIRELFVPALIFFGDPELTDPESETMQLLQSNTNLPATSAAILPALYAFKNGFNAILDIHPN